MRQAPGTIPDPASTAPGVTARLRRIRARSKDRREALGLTREAFAERAGIHRTYPSDIERGTRNLGLLNIERVALALSLKISELFLLAE